MERRAAYSGEFEGYRLVGGKYRRIEPDARGLLACDQLELKLGVQDRELRFYFPDGQLVPKPDEEAVTERARREEAEAELARLRAKLDEAKRF